MFCPRSRCLPVAALLAVLSPPPARALVVDDHLVKPKPQVTRLTDIEPGPGAGLGVDRFVALGGEIFFFGPEGADEHLWTLDPVTQVDPAAPLLNARGPIVHDGALHFLAQDLSSAGAWTLWRSNGSAITSLKALPSFGGTRLVDRSTGQTRWTVTEVVGSASPDAEEAIRASAERLLGDVRRE